MLNYLDKFSFLSNNQYGFRHLRSTTEAKHDNLQYIYASIAHWIQNPRRRTSEHNHKQS